MYAKNIPICLTNNSTLKNILILLKLSPEKEKNAKLCNMNIDFNKIVYAVFTCVPFDHDGNIGVPYDPDGKAAWDLKKPIIRYLFYRHPSQLKKKNYDVAYPLSNLQEFLEYEHERMFQYIMFKSMKHQDEWKDLTTTKAQEWQKQRHASIEETLKTFGLKVTVKFSKRHNGLMMNVHALMNYTTVSIQKSIQQKCLCCNTINTNTSVSLRESLQDKRSFCDIMSTSRRNSTISIFLPMWELKQRSRFNYFKKNYHNMYYYVFMFKQPQLISITVHNTKRMNTTSNTKKRIETMKIKDIQEFLHHSSNAELRRKNITELSFLTLGDGGVFYSTMKNVILQTIDDEGVAVVKLGPPEKKEFDFSYTALPSSYKNQKRKHCNGTVPPNKYTKC